MMDLTLFLSNKLKEAKIDFNYKASENPNLISKKLEFNLPVRSYAIVLWLFNIFGQS